jgi:uncharacterized membrane protein
MTAKKSLKGYLEGFLFLLNILLVFLLIFENYIQIPVWMFPLGRLHPLVLHFPIAFLLLLLLFDAFRPRFEMEIEHFVIKYSSHLLLIAVFVTTASAISGLFLSQEEGYDPESVNWHKWTGSGMSVLGYFYYVFRTKIQANKMVQRLATFGLIGLLLITGHLGATITHGENFVFESWKSQSVVEIDNAEVFTDLVQPIFEEKCVSCHNDKKTKGELKLNSVANIKKGGKTGPLFEGKDAEKSLLMERIFLDVDHKEHMPPKGKTQLSLEEKQILKWWVQKNAAFILKVKELPKNDSLYSLAQKRFTKSTTEEKYDFKKASAETIQKLNNEYRVINTLSKTSNALEVTLFNSKFYAAKSLEELTEIKEQMVTLNLSKVPIADKDLKTISQFKNLRHLNLNFTKISGKDFGGLVALPHLKTLDLGEIKVELKNFRDFLKKSKNLKSVSLWNSNLSKDELLSLEKEFQNISIITGGEENILKLNLPFLNNKPIVFKDSIDLKIAHPIKNVTIRFTTDLTEPDSLKSKIYAPGKTILHKTTTIKAKAYKTGWLGSDMATFTVFKNHYKPDSVLLLSKLNRVHPANGSATFFDQVFGTFNANSPAWANNWAGFRNNDMELLMVYKNPTSVSEVSINLLIETETGIYPPQLIEIWGGTSEKNMKKLGTSKPLQPKQSTKPFMQVASCKIKPFKGTYFKLVVKPFNVIRDGKPNPALFLIDEVFVN